MRRVEKFELKKDGKIKYVRKGPQMDLLIKAGWELEGDKEVEKAAKAEAKAKKEAEKQAKADAKDKAEAEKKANAGK